MAKARDAGPDQKKWIEPTTEGKCPYCKKHVKSLEHHIKDKHIEKLD